MSKLKILLTGASGFLGKNIEPILSEKYEVIGVGSEWDLRSIENAGNLIMSCYPDIIIHAAGTVGGILANKENPGKFMYDNLAMGMNMIEMARQFRISKFILLGTVCSYPKYTPVPFIEDQLWNGYPEETNAPYGIAKKALMKLIETYNQQYGLNGVNLIPVNMYGPHDHFNLTSSHVIPALILKFYNAIKNGDDIVILWGTGNASREFFYAPDLADALILAIEKDIGPEPINIGTGKEILISDLAMEIAYQMGFNGVIEFDSSKPDGQPRRCLSTVKARSILGFEAKTSFEEGLSNTIEWFKKNADTIL